MPKITRKDGVPVKIYGKHFPLIFIGEGPYMFEIKEENETKVYMFQTEEELIEFADRMRELHPDKEIKENKY